MFKRQKLWFTIKCLKNIHINSNLLYASLSFLTVLLLSPLDFDSSILDTIQFLWISINCDCPFTIHGIQVLLYDPVHHSAVTLSPSRANTRATWGGSSWNCWRPSAINSSGWISETSAINSNFRPLMFTMPWLSQM